MTMGIVIDVGEIIKEELDVYPAVKTWDGSDLENQEQEDEEEEDYED